MKVTVVGAGIAGLSTAWALTKRGHAVTLLEQGPIPNPLAASGDHHRIIRRAYGRASGYGALITEAYQAWDEMWADLGVSHYDGRGFVCFSREAGDEAEEFRDGLRDGGYPFEEMSGADAEERYPFLRPGAVRYGFYSPEGGALHCRRIALDLARFLRERGADVREHTRVASVDVQGGAVRLGSGERVEADLVVVTAGAWVTKLFPELTGTLTTYRTAVVYLEPPADLKSAWDAAPVVLDVGGRTDGYIIPASGGGGLKFGSGLHRRVHADADASRASAPGEGESIRDLFAPALQRLDEYRVEGAVSCAYTYTADERFVSFPRERCLVVSSCSGHGYKFGAAVGRRVAHAVESGAHDALQVWLEARAA